MARSLLLFLAFLIAGVSVSAQTSLFGKVADDAGEPVILGNVVIYKDGVFVAGTETDFDGNYNFSNTDPGTYDVQVSYVGLSTKKIAGVQVIAGKANKLDIELSSDAVNLDEIVVVDYKVPLIEQDNTTSGGVITSDQIKNLPTRNINALAANTAGLAVADEGDEVAIRGSRNNATDYYIDGIRIRGNLIPESEIDQLQVITGGIEAQYGDVTGGIISITTKGPSNAFSGGVEVESSALTDPYNQNLYGFNLSGPILRKTMEDGSKRSIIGFRLSGRLTDQLDDDPPATNIFRVKEGKLAELEANPVIVRGGTPFVAADFLEAGDVDVLDYKPNEEFQRIDLNGKVDARLSDAIDITLTGTYSDEEDRFTPGRTSVTGANWRVLNSHNNPTQNDLFYRANFRFRHRLGGSGGSSSDDQAGKGAIIQGASYVLQAGYERNEYDVADPRHGDNFFNYGYIGRFDQEWRPSWETQIVEDTTSPFGFNEIVIHNDYSQVLTDYDDSGTLNPVLANYNNVFENPDGENNYPSQVSSFNAFNGDVLNIFENSWGFHNNVGTVYNLYRKRTRDMYTFSARTSFDLVPGGSSEKGRHNIQLGVWYEQRTDREYSLNPRALWVLARQLANNHIQGIPVDENGLPTSEVIDSVLAFDPVTGAALINPITGEQHFGALHALDIAPNEESQFYQSIRDVTGDSLNLFVNVDALSPDQLSLGMFSSRELNDFTFNGFSILDYYGYTYTGEIFNGTFDDFFTAVDPETGLRTFPVAPNRPIYSAAYLQDKFTFKDIIFRLGVRVDRYDANTSVLKDNFSLYDIIGASDYHTEFGGDRPGNIGDDFKVYSTDETGSEVLAYRDENQWYEANGTPVNNPALIFQGGVINPVYAAQQPRDNANYIKEIGFDPATSFEDYEVQVNIMPRLAFSFPISDEANFFAHYDILVQRPPSNTIATAQDFYYFYDRTNVVKDNPNLRPERTVDYEVGFQQKLSNSSALKIAAYYKEMRDMIQRRTFFPVPIIGQYTSYDNLDFGTVKGFTFQYDLRRTGNVSFNANYTLQFADGTGSDADSQRGLTDRGNLRTLFPLTFDERHRIVATLDYRYGSGNKYNGPRLFGADIFANAGVNLQTIAVSGRPYTATQQANEPLSGAGTIGSINGARKPWNFTLNLRVDKNFSLGERMGLNIYCRVSNLLDRRNIINVYSVTGAADDDGYLTGPIGVGQINDLESTQREVSAYLASYQWRLLNPNFFSLPRRIYLGAIFDF
jgi:hypothetical protein